MKKGKGRAKKVVKSEGGREKRGESGKTKGRKRWKENRDEKAKEGVRKSRREENRRRR